MRFDYRAKSLGLLWCLVLAIEPSHALAASNSDIGGTVFTVGSDGIRSVIAGAEVLLEATQSPRETHTDQQGRFTFADVAPATYQVEVSARGLVGNAAVSVVSGKALDIQIELKPAAVSQSVTVKGSEDPPVSADPSGESVINRSVVVDAPNKYDDFDALFPLIPGVVRGPDGLINIKGTRSSQSGALLNSANVSDPATGNPAISLPIDVVQSVKVIPNPYDPEYGRLTGAVSEVETTNGDFDAWRFTIQNLFVRPRKRDGDFIGIESATPRFTLTGPLVKHKIAFTQSFEYRFIRIPVDSLPQLQRDTKLEGFNSFTQVDVNLSQRQSLTVSLALYPQKYNYLGLNTFTPQPSTPDLHQRGYMADLQHRYTIGSDSLLISQVSYKRFDADTTANSTAPYELLVETTEGGYFNQETRNTGRTEWQETWESGARHFLGSHLFKAGLDYAHSGYDGRVDLLPVTIAGVLGTPIERIDFGPASHFDVRQNELGWFLADKWTVSPRLTLDLGARFDYDSVTGSVNTAPRAGFALMLTRDAKTLLKGGAGLFYASVPLNIVSFPLLPDRTVIDFAPDGGVLNSTSYANTITEARLRNPRSAAYNVEFDRELTSNLLVRAGFQQRSTTHDFLLTPQIDADQGALSISNGGSDSYREFQLTGVYRIRENTLNASYVRSKAYGDLNDFNQFFGNDGSPVIEPNQRGLLPFDTPNRFLFWGQIHAPFKLTVMPTLDVHTGFPWSVTDEYRDFIGPRDSQRLPRFNSLDMQITRPVALPFPHKDIKARVGFSVYNLLNHFNPRDVQSDIDSGRFDDFFNGVGRTFRGKFVLEL